MKYHTLFFILIPIFSACNSGTADWPHIHGPHRNATSDESGLRLSGWDKQAPKILWEMKLNEGYSGASIMGDEAFIIDRVPGTADELICINMNDGSKKWSYKHEADGRLNFPGSRGVPSIEADAVYYNGGFGQVYRINRKTQKLDWMIDMATQYDAEAPMFGWSQSPLIVDNVLIIAPMSRDVGLVGVDKTNGKELWRTPPLGTSHSTPISLTLQGVKQVLFVAREFNPPGVKDKEADHIGSMLSVDPLTGNTLWQTDIYPNRLHIPPPLKIDEHRLFLTGGYEYGSKMIELKKQGTEWKITELWKIPRGSQVHPAILHDNHLYMIANENANHAATTRDSGGLTCIDLNGNIKWNTGDKPFFGRGAMLYLQNKLLIQDGELGYLRVIDPNPSEYTELEFADIFEQKEKADAQIEAQKGRKRIKLPSYKFWSPMALSDGRLIMRAQENLRCVSLH